MISKSIYRDINKLILIRFVSRWKFQNRFQQIVTVCIDIWSVYMKYVVYSSLTWLTKSRLTCCDPGRYYIWYIPPHCWSQWSSGRPNMSQLTYNFLFNLDLHDLLSLDNWYWPYKLLRSDIIQFNNLLKINQVSSWLAAYFVLVKMFWTY